MHPDPAEIRAARVAWGGTQRQAGELVYAPRSWEAWEAGRWKMPPAAWELFLIKTRPEIAELLGLHKPGERVTTLRKET